MLELLAPAGNSETLRAALKSGADAIYIGGKQYHMRLLRRGFHFDEAALREAVAAVHAAGKKLYVTVNNLIFEDELDGLRDYLLFLQAVGADALIVQDMGLLKVAAEVGLSVPLHSSVQMGAHNAETLRALRELGVCRAVLSRNVTLDEVRAMHAQCPEMELEYFIHGDSCASHEGQCRLSGFADMSGNRGRCLKPCRWAYRLNGEGEPAYLLAQKDLCLLGQIDALAAAGVISLKIEGRMRESGYIAHLVSVYRAAIDHSAPGEELQQRLDERRVREFCTGGLERRIDRRDIDESGSREPRFISRHHRFRTVEAANCTTAASPTTAELPRLAVKVHDLPTLTAAAEAGAEALTVPPAPFRQHKMRWDDAALAEACAIAHRHGAALRLELPLILREENSGLRATWLAQKRACGADALIVHELGSLRYYREQGETALIAGLGLNLANHEAIAAVLAAGAQAATLSTELRPVELTSLIAGQPCELLVQGPLCGLVSDLCLLTDDTSVPGDRACTRRMPFLEDEIGQRYRLLTDGFCQSYLFAPGERAAVAELPAIVEAGLRCVQIDATFYDAETTAALVALYRRALRAAAGGTLAVADVLTEIESLTKQALLPLFAGE